MNRSAALACVTLLAASHIAAAQAPANGSLYADGAPAQHHGPMPKIDLKKPDRFYADPSAPNISGVWYQLSDGYHPPRVTADTTVAPLGGLPPGVLPRHHWIVDGKPLPGRLASGPYVGIPYTPAWEAAYQARLTSNEAGKTYGDPFLDCLPRGAIAVYNHAGTDGFAITQTPGRVQQVFEEQSKVRDIFTDHRHHAAWADVDGADYDPKPMGDSIGHWEGSTLVVDTIGVSPEYTLGYYAPHSDALHVVERFTRLDPMHMDVDIAIDDKKALARPMSMKIRYELQPGADLVENLCDSYRNSTDAQGYMQSITKSKRRAGWDLPQ